ncbi:coth protein-domain-containing protein [Gongronella butleri]|nr:coth protein-domain-containing protein [Gongronella butleri]
MKTSLAVFAFSSLLSISQAAAVTFNVIAPGAQSVQVAVNGGNPVTLNAQDASVPVFSGQTDAPDGAKYKYIVGGTAEAFDRTLDQGRTSTRNDFYNRPITYANIPELPWPIKNNSQWTRGGAPTAGFDSNYIPTIFVQGDDAQLQSLVKNVPKDLLSVKLTFVDADGVHTFNNVSFGIHGAGKKKNNAKQSWKWTLSGNDEIYNRNYFKLRHMEEDPTQIREKLYADILKAMGSYANEANMVRLFINGQGYGTFNMLDDVTEYSYITARFFGGKAPTAFGPLFDGASGASFAYSATGDYFSFIPNPASPQGVTALDPICKAINTTNYKDDASIDALSKQFDLDQFMRFMVVEYLAADWDGYWQEQTNIGAYQDATDKKWYYLGQDYDATFGVNLAQTRDFVSASYKTFPTKFPNGILINNLLQNDKMRNTFETYLKDTVTQLFNNVTLTNRILKYHEFILPDLQWDRSITQQSPGINFGWTFDQCTQNLWQAVAAPNANGGGAGWGLIEWIAAKADAVAKEFNLTITTTPLGPPTNGTTTPSSTPSSTASNSGVKPAGSGSNASSAASSTSVASMSVALFAAVAVAAVSAL